MSERDEAAAPQRKEAPVTTPKTWEEVREIAMNGVMECLEPGSPGTVSVESMVDAAARALRAAGLTVVPREATEAMIEVSDALEIARAGMQHLWSAALSAGELAPPDKGEG